METALFPVVAGCMFILLGRWAYRNPRRLYVGSVYSNPDSPFLKNFVRLSATFFIFLGAVASLTAIGEFLIGDRAVVIYITLPIALVATWFLRPRVVETSGSMGGPTMNEPGHRVSLLTRRGKLLFAITIATSLICLAAISAFVWLRK